MRLLRATLAEIVGLFVDDGALAAQIVLLVAGVAAGVRWLALPPLAGAGLLLAGCLAILAASLERAGRR